MADRRASAYLTAGLWQCAALAATALAVAGCGGQSDRNQVTTVARTYDRAFLARDGRTLCALMTASLRRELTGSPGLPAGAGCAEQLAFAAGTVRGASTVDPVVSDVRVRGSRASVTLRTSAGVGVLPLSREAGRWRVAGPVRYIRRIWLRADYRLRTAGGPSTASVAAILAHRAEAIIGTYAEARAIGDDEVRLAVAEPVRLADLRLVTQRSGGRLSIYDWEKDALTRAGKPVSDQLRRRDGSAFLISQGSGTQSPGESGGMPRSDAVKLAAAQRPVAGWTVLAARAPAGDGQDPGSQFFVLRDRAALSRADIAGAHAGIDARGDPDIGLEFTPSGARAFRRLTAEIARRGAALSSPGLVLNQHVAAVLDGKLLSVLYVDFRVYPLGIPTAHGAEITGGFTALAAQQLAAEISAPALPADLELIDSTTFTRRGA